MTDEVKKIIVQVRAPRGTFHGEVVEGWYVVADNAVIMTDRDGKPIDSEKHHLSPGQDARLIACRMVRNNRKRRASVAGFNRSISYPKVRF